MSSGTRVYVGRLNYQTSEKDLERFFRGYGRVVEINLKNGFGFVEFEDSRDADDAVYDLNGKELMGERLIIELARGPGRSRGGDDRYGGYRGGPRRGGFDRFGSRGGSRQGRDGDRYGPPVRTQYRLLVGNLSSRVSWQDLKDYVRQAGEVTFADAHKQRQGEGVIEFGNRDDMENAIRKLDNTELSGRKITLTEDKGSSRRRSRSRSKSRGRSRTPSKSRSRSPRSRSRSKSRSRSPAAKRSRSRSPTPKRSENGDARKSQSKSPARSKSRSRSRSPPPAKDD